MINKKATLLSLLLSTVLILPFSISAATVSNESASKTSTNFSAGEIRLVKSPNISFGKQKINIKNEKYDAVNITDEILVIDGRGNQNGWELRAQLSPFVDISTGESGCLNGSSLIINSQNISSYKTSALYAPSKIYGNVELVSGDNINHSIISARKGEGGGGWTLDLDNQDVKLYIPRESAKPGSYSADINWILMDAPV